MKETTNIGTFVLCRSADFIGQNIVGPVRTWMRYKKISLQIFWHHMRNGTWM